MQGIKDSAQQSIADDTEKTNLVFEEYANLMAEDMGIAEPGIPGGAITFEDVKWTGNGTATVVVKTSSTGLTLQYQVNSTTGNWTTIQSGATIQNLRHGNKVYARLYDGTNESEYEVKEILDEIPPIVTIEVTDLTWDGVKLNVTASDGQSGLATSGRYTYYLNNTKKVSNNTSSYKYTGLTGSTKYTLKVVVKDNAGKTSEVSVIITTPQRVITVESKLKEGDYVYYIDANNVRRKCAVLYGPENENYAKYGLQVISVEAIEQITMGEDEGPLDYITTNESTRAYDAAIQTLNSAVNKHLNTAYATGVRCVGSSPDDPFGENYVPDDKQLKALGLNNISCVYASRYIETTSPGIAPTEEWWNGHNYGLNSPNGRVFLYGELRYSYVNKQQFFSSKITCPVVPVFTLRPELKIVSGEGTSERPYLLEF